MYHGAKTEFMNQIIGPSYELYWKLQIKISWTGTWNIDWKKLKEGRKGEKIKKIKKNQKKSKNKKHVCGVR